MRFSPGSSSYFGVKEAAGFFQGGALSPLVPEVYPVSLDGRPYMIDLSQPFYRQYHRQIAPLVRTQADASKEPGEHSLDPNGLWRRSFEDWLLGAGQRYLDRETSIPNGFYSSKGIDALSDRWQMQLLKDTASAQTAAYTNLSVIEANNRIYIGYNQTLAYTTTLEGVISWTTVTGTPSHNISSLCTDGFTVYAAYGASGIYSTVTNTSTASQYTTSAIGSAAVIGYVNGRLMLGNNSDGTHGDGSLYNITTSGSLPAALMVPSSGANTVWVGFAEGNSFLYAAAQVGNNSLIYGCTVLSDGTTLSPPSVQGKLPNGESITGIYGYLGDLILGSSLGVRFAQATTTGVTLGSLISGQTSVTAYGPTSSVQCMWGYGRWVYFGWTNYDGVSTGLGRLDLENFVIENDLPAFQSDLMATTQGAVLGVAVLAGDVIFAVSGVGFYAETETQVASGVLQTGYIFYDLVDRKIASLLDIQTVLPVTSGSVVGAISVDGGTFTAYATVNSTSGTPYTFGLPGLSGQKFELQFILSGPVAVSRWTLRAYPAPIRPITWQLPLILDENIINRSGATQGFDPLTELKALELMANSGQPVVYQEGEQGYTVFVQDVEFLPDDFPIIGGPNTYFNGLALVTLEGLPVPGT